MSAEIIPFPSKRSPREGASQALAARLHEIELRVRSICRHHLDAEYERLCTQLLDEVVELDATTFSRGRVEIWASAIVHCVGAHNNLFHAWFGPRLPATDLAEIADASMPSINNRSKQLRELIALDDLPHVADRYARQTADAPAGFAAMLAQAGDMMPSPVAVLIDRLESLDGLVGALEHADVELEPTAPELVAALRLHADRMRTALATSTLSHSDVDDLSIPVVDVMGRGHDVNVRLTARAAIDQQLFGELGSSVVPVTELAIAALENSFAGDDPSDVLDVLVARRAGAFPSLLTAIANGVVWARRAGVAAPAWVDADLHADLDDSMHDLEMYESYSLGIAPPTTVIAFDAVESVALTWSEQLDRGAGRLLDEARDRAVTKLPADPDIDLAGAFDVGVAYAFAEAIFDQRTTDAGVDPCRTADGARWLSVFTGDLLPIDEPITGEACTYELVVTLEDTAPAIWRRVRVDSTITLSQLHVVLQAAMGWTNSHLHEFVLDETRYTDPDLVESYGDEPRTIDTRTARLCDIAPALGSTFSYLYDFGDSWTHHVVVDRVSEHQGLESIRARRPLVLDGARACPPEDVGGTGGFERMLVSLADPEHEAHDSFLKWLGGPYHAARFDPSEFDGLLALLKQAYADRRP